MISAKEALQKSENANLPEILKFVEKEIVKASEKGETQVRLSGRLFSDDLKFIEQFNRKMVELGYSLAILGARIVGKDHCVVVVSWA